MGDNPPLLLTDSDVDALAREFLRSRYLGPIYADWSPDRRLSRVADNGDLASIVLDRVMAHVGRASRPARNG